MIVTANENYIKLIMNLSAEDPFACRIISQYNSYDSSLAFVDYWTIIDDETDECTGAISRCGTNFILFLTDKTNLEEVSSFMRVAGASSAICSGDFNLNLYGSKSVSGLILKKSDPPPLHFRFRTAYAHAFKHFFTGLKRRCNDHLIPGLQIFNQLSSKAVQHIKMICRNQYFFAPVFGKVFIYREIFTLF